MSQKPSLSPTTAGLWTLEGRGWEGSMDTAGSGLIVIELRIFVVTAY